MNYSFNFREGPKIAIGLNAKKRLGFKFVGVQDACKWAQRATAKYIQTFEDDCCAVNFQDGGVPAHMLKSQSHRFQKFGQ